MTCVRRDPALRQVWLARRCLSQYFAAPTRAAASSRLPGRFAPTVAVIGGGQLARMLAEPAAALGIPLRLLAEAEGVSAAQVIPDTIVGDYRDLEMLRKVTGGAAVVTFDHEHVPTEHLHALAEAGVAVRPGPEALVHAQDKAVMRARLTELGRAVPAARRRDVGRRTSRRSGCRACSRPPAAGTTAAGCGWSATTRRPRRRSRPRRRPASRCWPRSSSTSVASWPRWWRGRRAARPRRTRSSPAPSSTASATRWSPRRPTWRPELATHAQQVALTIAKELDVVGILAVELFETRDGRVLVNELAMRPHNTGHWTQDGAVTSQFENHLRAVLDLPLGSPAPRAPWTVMVNILGGPTDQVGRLYDGYPHALARDPRLRVHLYGKELRPGRKVGHVNAYGDDLEDCLERARHAAAWFRGDLGNESE